jgi:hypothetical protein
LSRSKDSRRRTSFRTCQSHGRSIGTSQSPKYKKTIPAITAEQQYYSAGKGQGCAIAWPARREARVKALSPKRRVRPQSRAQVASHHLCVHGVIGNAEQPVEASSKHHLAHAIFADCFSESVNPCASRLAWRRPHLGSPAADSVTPGQAGQAKCEALLGHPSSIDSLIGCVRLGARSAALDGLGR